MLVQGHFVAVVGAPRHARFEKIRRVRVHEFITAKIVLPQILDPATLVELDRGMLAPAIRHIRIEIHPDVTSRQTFATHDRAGADKRLDVHPVWRHQVDEALRGPL